MENKFTKKLIKEFMEETMKEKLFHQCNYTTDEICVFYTEWSSGHPEYPVCFDIESKIDLINALCETLGSPHCLLTYSSTDEEVRILQFYVSPFKRSQWDAVMKKLGDASEQQ